MLTQRASSRAKSCVYCAHNYCSNVTFCIYTFDIIVYNIDLLVPATFCYYSPSAVVNLWPGIVQSGRVS